MLIEKITCLGIIEVYIVASIKLMTSNGFNLIDRVGSWLLCLSSSMYYIFHLLLFPLFFVIDHFTIGFSQSQLIGVLKSFSKNGNLNLLEFLDGYLCKQSCQNNINGYTIKSIYLPIHNVLLLGKLY